MTPARPLVSCIIPVWNAEPFLHEAIESVVGQTYAEWELVLVDDGSTDASPAIIDRAVASDPDRVHVLRHPGGGRRGVTATRNLGIRNARGSYVAFLDADDIWLPSKLGDQVALLAAHPSAAMVYGRTIFWNRWRDGDGGAVEDGLTDLVVAPDRVVDPPHLVELFLRNETAVCTVNSVMVRREVIDAVGGFDESFPDFYEDFVLWIKVALRWPIYVSGHTWDRYRQHPGNACAMAERDGWYDSARPNPATATYLRWVAFHLAKEGVTDRRIWRALEARLWAYRHPRVHAALTTVTVPARGGVKAAVGAILGARGRDAIRGVRRRQLGADLRGGWAPSD